MKSSSESQIMGEFWSIEKTNILKCRLKWKSTCKKLTILKCRRKVIV